MASSTALRPRPALPTLDGQPRRSEGATAAVTSPATGAAADIDALAAADATPLIDWIDDAFIDSTIVVRTVITPALNSIGFLGKQIYVGVNFAESILASAVFNGTDILRGEGVSQNLGDFAADVGYSLLWVAIDEAAIGISPDAIAIDRAPLNRPSRWDDADPPFKGVPLSVPNRDRVDVTVEEDVSTATESIGHEAAPTTNDTEESTRAASAADRSAVSKDSPGPRLFKKWNAKKAEKKAEQAAAAEDTGKADADGDKTDESDKPAAPASRGSDGGTGDSDSE